MSNIANEHCGEDNGVEKEPTVRYYVMGAVGEKDARRNVWRTAKDWPPVNMPTPLYLHGDGMTAVQPGY